VSGRAPARLAAAAAVLSLLALASCGRSRGVYPLTDEVVRTYLEVHPPIHRAFLEGVKAGERPATTAQRPEVAAALARAGWSVRDYLRVDGSISNAMLFLESPARFRRMELTEEDAPPENVRVVNVRYFELKRMKLILEAETEARE
jgi:hypothetical protein